MVDCDIGEVFKGFLTTRMYHFNFMFKILALCINFYCLDTFTLGVEGRMLPVYSAHATAIFYFTIPTYNVILSGICVLFIINQIPSKLIQQVYLLTGICMYIISGTMGIVNTRDNDFLPEMFVMSCLLLAVAAAMTFDYIILRDYFVPHRKRPPRRFEEEEEDSDEE
ncbi:uncharacterized protein LOC128993629 [Macrosteles quadrilineatus]|uniref:uncharacterized protein LOC128993629 n=1 Tax=Macrosteles quadrilineatus TaxID=74068 RepID=UPI0023E16A1F|nr:uncharacterized protein LOC128993629 [Macrosteles quadrilineatus]